MAYVTGGSGGNLTDLVDALRGFCLGLGWTIDRHDLVNKVLFMTKGRCAITMWWGDTSTVNIWSGPNNGGISTATVDNRLWFALNTANNGALTTYYGHPGSVVTSAFDSDACFVNGLNGNFVGWHFFADPTVGDHVHVIVQTAADTFAHFSFGHADNKGLTHGGVAYVTAVPNRWYRDVNLFNPSTSGAFNRPNSKALPFLVNPGNFTGSGSYRGEASCILRNSDAWPAAWNAGGVEIAGSNGSTPHFGALLRLFSGGFDNPSQFPTAGGVANQLLDMLVISEATPYSNIVPLFPLPMFKQYDNALDSTLNRVCYLGDFPNVRACNMSNMLPGQEIILDADTWKVFPALRQETWAMSGITDRPSTGQFAIAYKKVP